MGWRVDQHVSSKVGGWRSSRRSRQVALHRRLVNNIIAPIPQKKKATPVIDEPEIVEEVVEDVWLTNSGVEAPEPERRPDDVKRRRATTSNRRTTGKRNSSSKRSTKKN